MRCHVFSSALVSGIGVFEGFDNLTEIVCVGIAFLSTATLGTGFGRLQCLGGDKRKREERQFYRSAGRLTGTVVITGIIAAAVLLVIAKPLASQFLTDSSDREALRLAVLMVQGCAGGFIFYLLNTELVSYHAV